jgi:hypothetical protein
MVIPNCYLFADDCLLVNYGKDPVESARAMEISIEEASNWYTQNLLVLNTTKTDIMTISRNKVNSLPNLQIKDLSLKQSPKIKYLGVILDNQLTFKSHISKIKQKLYPIMSNFNRNRKFLSPNLAALWYKGLIRPILEYGAPLLYCSNQSLHNEILKIENRCLKIINFDQHKNTTRSIHNIFPIPQRLKYLYLLSFYKLIRGLVPCIDNSLLPVGLSSDTRLADGGGFRLAGSCHKFSLNYLGAKLFNELPSSIRTQSNLKSFKAHLRCLIFTQ